MSLEIRDVVTFTKYTDKKSGEEKKRWTRIGAAFISEEGQNINIQLDALPINGNLNLFVRKPKELNTPQDMPNSPDSLPF